MQTVFEKHITKYEVTNQCLILEDDAGTEYAKLFTGENERLSITCEGREFEGILREYYVKNKFKLGIYFHHDEGHVSEFFFETSLAEGKRARFTFDPEAPAKDGKRPLQIEIILITRKV